MVARSVREAFCVERVTWLEQDRHRVGVQQQVGHVNLMRDGGQRAWRPLAQLAYEGQKLIGFIRVLAFLIRERQNGWLPAGNRRGYFRQVLEIAYNRRHDYILTCIARRSFFVRISI